MSALVSRDRMVVSEILLVPDVQLGPEALLGADVECGPEAQLRPSAHLRPNAHLRPDALPSEGVCGRHGKLRTFATEWASPAARKRLQNAAVPRVAAGEAAYR